MVARVMCAADAAKTHLVLSSVLSSEFRQIGQRAWRCRDRAPSCRVRRGRVGDEPGESGRPEHELAKQRNRAESSSHSLSSKPKSGVVAIIPPRPRRIVGWGVSAA
jgi:hypothetical protein